VAFRTAECISVLFEIVEFVLVSLNTPLTTPVDTASSTPMAISSSNSVKPASDREHRPAALEEGPPPRGDAARTSRWPHHRL
jgi:hypothetical protein